MEVTDKVGVPQAPKCPQCGAPVINWHPFSRCSQCKTPFSAELDAQMSARVSPPAQPGPVASGVVTNPREVVITDIRMPFGSMVIFIFKWALASIPAMLMLIVLGFFVAAVFGVVMLAPGEGFRDRGPWSPIPTATQANWRHLTPPARCCD